MRIGNREFDTEGHTYVMGILNVTPDSFFDGGRWNDKDRALRRVETMLAEGMDIVDVGGESTRPGYTMISDQEEIERIAPVIEVIRENFDVPISLDTCKGEVARAGIAAGADLINDIRGLQYDSKMAEMIAKSGLPCCLMHSRREADYQNFMQEIVEDFVKIIETARQAGIADEKIILDPGVGFGKTYENNQEILKCLEEFNMLGYPLLLGCSRKSVIGTALDLPVEERLEGTLATTVLAVAKGYSFVRVHDVKENVRAIRMAEAILRR